MRKPFYVILFLVFIATAIQLFYVADYFQAIINVALALFCAGEFVPPGEEGAATPTVALRKQSKASIPPAQYWNATVSSWPFELQVAILKAIININIVYVETAEEEIENIESKQVESNPVTGNITIKMEII